MNDKETQLKEFQKALFKHIIANDWQIKSINFFISIDDGRPAVFGSYFTKEGTSTQDFFAQYENKKLIFT